MSRNRREAGVIHTLPAVACVFLFLTHLYFVVTYSVDVPVGDEWELLNPNALSKNLSLKWLFTQHNEHRIVLTKIMAWLLYKWDSWDIRVSNIINWFIYAMLPLSISLFLRLFKKEEKRLIVWFFPFLFSTLAIENFIWSFQSQFHLFLIFYILSVWLVFQENLDLKKVFLAIVTCILSVYSFSAGVPCIFSLLVGFIFWKVYQRKVLKEHKESLWVGGSLCFGIVAVLASWWLFGYVKNPYHPPIIFPYKKIFIQYFLNIVSLGVGVTKIKYRTSVIVFGWVLIPFIFLFSKAEHRKNRRSWMIGSAVFGILAALASISMGRAGFGVVQSKVSRYSEVGMVLIPFVVMAWSIVLCRRRSLRGVVLFVSWSFLFASFFNHWNFSLYIENYDQKIQGLNCIRSSYLSSAECLCPQIYPVPLDRSKLSNARDLRVSFYRKMFPSEDVELHK